MTTLSEQDLIKMFYKYPSVVLKKTGSIVFIHTEHNYNVHSEIEKTRKRYNDAEKRLFKLSKTLCQKGFYDNASQDVITKLCYDLSDLEDEVDNLKMKWNYLIRAIREHEQGNLE